MEKSKDFFLKIKVYFVLIFFVNGIFADKRQRWIKKFKNFPFLKNAYVLKTGLWGLANLRILKFFKGRQAVLSVFYPKNSSSPSGCRLYGFPLGGSGFKVVLNKKKAFHKAFLSYFVYFPKNFQFVRGGKLPGIFGGRGNSGGNIPNGLDGFSVRLMWRKKRSRRDIRLPSFF